MLGDVLCVGVGGGWDVLGDVLCVGVGGVGGCVVCRGWGCWGMHCL